MSISITLRQALRLAEIFGGTPEAFDGNFEAPITLEEGVDEVQGPGLYATLDELGPESRVFLGPNEVSPMSDPLDVAFPRTQAERDVLAERHRHTDELGFSATQDDTLPTGDLASAGACYLLSGGGYVMFGEVIMTLQDGGSPIWPWDVESWHPSTAADQVMAHREDLVKGVALGLAEIEKIDRVIASRPRIPMLTWSHPSWGSDLTTPADWTVENLRAEGHLNGDGPGVFLDESELLREEVYLTQEEIDELGEWEG